MAKVQQRRANGKHDRGDNDPELVAGKFIERTEEISTIFTFKLSEYKKNEAELILCNRILFYCIKSLIE